MITIPTEYTWIIKDYIWPLAPLSLFVVSIMGVRKRASGFHLFLFSLSIAISIVGFVVSYYLADLRVVTCAVLIGAFVSLIKPLHDLFKSPSATGMSDPPKIPPVNAATNITKLIQVKIGKPAEEAFEKAKKDVFASKALDYFVGYINRTGTEIENLHEKGVPLPHSYFMTLVDFAATAMSMQAVSRLPPSAWGAEPSTDSYIESQATRYAKQELKCVRIFAGPAAHFFADEQKTLTPQFEAIVRKHGNIPVGVCTIKEKNKWSYDYVVFDNSHVLASETLGSNHGHDEVAQRGAVREYEGTYMYSKGADELKKRFIDICGAAFFVNSSKPVCSTCPVKCQ